MLATIIIWAYSLGLFYIYGAATVKLSKKFLNLNVEESPSSQITILVGIAVVTTIASYLSILIPLSLLAAAILAAGGIVLVIVLRPVRKPIQARHVFIWILILLSGLILLENAITSPTNPDTALYHAQTIRWMETYRVVPGLANIHYRLAENSSWLTLSAVFSFAFLGLQSFHLMDSLFILVGLFYFSEGPRNIIQGKLTISSVAKFILFFLSIYIYRNELSSPGTDLPATMLIWIISILLVEKLELGGFQFDILSVAIFLLSIFALTVKLSALPLIFIAFLIIVQQFRKRDFINSFNLAGIGLLVLLPWVIRNVILSGYLVFPVSQIDVFALDWKYPPANADSNRLGIIWYARFPGKDWSNFVGLPISKWAPEWFNNLSFNQKALFLGAAISPLGLVLFAAPPNLKLLERFLWPYLVNYLGVVFWLLTAPNVRFGYGFLTTTIILIISSIITAVMARFAIGSGLVITILLLSLYQGYALVTTTNFVFLREHLILPADYLPSRTDPCQIHNATVFCRKVANQCNYEDFPCIPSPQPNVEMRGTTWQDGFRTISNP